MRFWALVFGWWVYKPYSALIAWLLRMKGIRVGINFYIQGVPYLKIRGKAQNIRIGNNVQIYGDIDLRNRENGVIIIEDDVVLDTGCRFVAAREGTIRISRGANLGCYCIVNGGADITIGEDVLCAGFCYIQSSTHGIQRSQRIKQQPHTHRPVHIGADVWIGAHVTVLPGVSIGEGAVIGAKSVVTKNVPPYSVWAGVPAAPIGQRLPD